MSIYRNEHDALRAQVDELERMLEQSRRDFAEVTARALASESKLAQLREVIGTQAAPSGKRGPSVPTIFVCASACAVLAGAAVALGTAPAAPAPSAASPAASTEETVHAPAASAAIVVRDLSPYVPDGGAQLLARQGRDISSIGLRAETMQRLASAGEAGVRSCLVEHAGALHGVVEVTVTAGRIERTRAWLPGAGWSRRDASTAFERCAADLFRSIEVPAEEVPAGATQTLAIDYDFGEQGHGAR